MNFEMAKEWMDANESKAQAIAYEMARMDVGEIAADDLDAITETGIRRGISTNQSDRVERLVDKFAAEAEREAAADSREAYEAVLAKF